MAKPAVGDKVIIEAKVTRVSDDGLEVTVRIPHYDYPVTLPVDSVGLTEPTKGAAKG